MPLTINIAIAVGKPVVAKGGEIGPGQAPDLSGCFRFGRYGNGDARSAEASSRALEQQSRTGLSSPATEGDRRVPIELLEKCG